MADWKRLAKALVLADGNIDEREANIVRKELTADAKIDRSELEFLIDLRRSAKAVASSFNQFYFMVFKKIILADGEISDKEAKWLRQQIFADRKVDADEKRFLQELRREAKQLSAEFLTLYDECMAS